MCKLMDEYQERRKQEIKQEFDIRIKIIEDEIKILKENIENAKKIIEKVECKADLFLYYEELDIEKNLYHIEIR